MTLNINLQNDDITMNYSMSTSFAYASTFASNVNLVVIQMYMEKNVIGILKMKMVLLFIQVEITLTILSLHLIILGIADVILLI